MLVQAKRLDNEENVYSGLSQKIGKSSPPVLQIDQLIKTAADQGVPAFYAFYNHVSDPSRIPQTCKSLSSGDPDHIRAFGISLAAAWTVKSKLPSITFDTHRQHSVPLHCLLCSRGSKGRPSSGIAEHAASQIAIMQADYVRTTEVFEFFGVREGLHPIVKRALSKVARRADDYESAEADEMPGIAGVVILHDLNDKKSADDEGCKN